MPGSLAYKMQAMEVIARLFRSTTATILSIVVFNLLCYICIGLPLAVVPSFVTTTLGGSAVVAGLAISLQYLATLASRAMAGRMTDERGPRRAVLIGAGWCLASGLLLGASGLLGARASSLGPWPALGLLLAARLALGTAESFTATGVIMWCIRRTGAENTATSISWNGITSYGGMAIGAPLGVALAALVEHGDHTRVGGAAIVAIAALTCLCALLILALASRRAPVPGVAGTRIAFTSVLRRVAPFGAGLALAGTGFGVIAAFLALYYAARDWSGAALSLSLFGVVFVATRLVFASAIGRHGGFRVSLVSLAVEVAGLLCLWLAPHPLVATIGAGLTGAGFALIFPALGVEAVGTVGAENRGAALGAYSVFLDVSLGIAGPLDGAIAGHAGYPATFLFSAGCCLAAFALTAWLLWRRGAQPV